MWILTLDQGIATQEFKSNLDTLYMILARIFQEVFFLAFTSIALRNTLMQRQRLHYPPSTIEF